MGDLLLITHLFIAVQFGAAAQYAASSYGYAEQPYQHYQTYQSQQHYPGAYSAPAYPGYMYGNQIHKQFPYHEPIGTQMYGQQGTYGQLAGLAHNYYAANRVGHREPKSGFGGFGGHSTHNAHQTVHKKKKKQKIISIDKGLFIAGGAQAFGKFKSLKSCMKACAVSSSCFAGDYNPWLGKCYFHGNVTACNTMSSHSKLTHFKKIPCDIPGAPRANIILGAQLFGGVVQKGIKDLASCLKKCLNAGGGVASAPTDLSTPTRGGQICFGVDYDFSSHKCYFHVQNRRRIATATQVLCPETSPVIIRTPVDLMPNPSVVHIVVCPTI